MTEVGTEVESDGDATIRDDASSSDAFAVLGNEVRTAVLRVLAEADEPRSFSELFEASDVETSAGFAYHLRQLTDHYVAKTDDERYRLTYAGTRMARDIRAGTYTDTREFESLAVEDPCPFCDSTALEARGEDNHVAIGCTDCGRLILSLPLPPGNDAESEDLLEALDRHYRHRISTMAEGTCPECSAAVETVVSVIDDSDADDAPSPCSAQLECQRCGWHLGCPVTLAVLEHPAVVSFYHEHGQDLRDRPLWNVGEEWRETVLSTDPVCVRVATELDDERLELLVGRDLTVVETRRVECEESGRGQQSESV